MDAWVALVSLAACVWLVSVSSWLNCVTNGVVCENENRRQSSDGPSETWAARVLKIEKISYMINERLRWSRYVISIADIPPECAPGSTNPGFVNDEP